MVDQKPGYMSPGFRTPGNKVHQRRSRAAVVRRRRIGIAVALVVIAAVAVVTAFVWPGFARAEDPAPEVTVTAAPPTPTAEPADLPDGATALLSALPASVLQLVRLDVVENTEWVEDVDAIEAWDVTYTDGSTGGAEVTLAVGQWSDEGDAEDVVDALADAAGTPTASGDVTVGDEVVGTYALTPGTTPETAVLTWRNGTVVLRASGPDQLVQDFYQTFPL